MSGHTRRVMVATDEHDLLTEMRRLDPPYAEFSICEDGLKCVAGVAEALKADTPLALAVLDLSRGRPDGWSTGLLIRSVEAGLAAAQCPILILAERPADAMIERRLQVVGRAVYMQKGSRQSARTLAHTLSRAVERLVGGAT